MNVWLAYYGFGFKRLCVEESVYVAVEVYDMS